MTLSCVILSSLSPLPPFPLLPSLPLYPSYTSLDENRLRFDIQRQYHHIEQANSYRPFSLPSNPSKTRPTTAPTYSDPYRRDHTGVLKVWGGDWRKKWWLKKSVRERERGITGTLHPFKLSLISLSLQSEMTQSQLECLNNFKKYIYTQCVIYDLLPLSILAVSLFNVFSSYQKNWSWVDVALIVCYLYHIIICMSFYNLAK